MIEALKTIIKENKQYIGTTWTLASIDRMRQYKGSVMGWVWAFAMPVVYVSVMWFAVSLGLRGNRDIEGLITPSIFWLTAGILCWFYIRDMINTGTTCFRAHRLFIRRLSVPVSIIPSVQSLSRLVIHWILMGAFMVLMICTGNFPTVYWLQLPLYMALMIVMGISWGFIGGLMSAMSRDFYNMIKSITMAIFWISGIIFDIGSVHSHMVQDIMKWNPISFIVEGYRNCFVREVWITDDPKGLAIFMGEWLLFVILAAWMYKKLGKTVADVI